jgi:hypothetical protein
MPNRREPAAGYWKLERTWRLMKAFWKEDRN